MTPHQEALAAPVSEPDPSAYVTIPPDSLICPAVGGTPAEAWIPREALEADPELQGLVAGNWLDNPRLDMKTPASFEYNVGVTKKVVDMAHAGGVSVEGELGCLGSLETGEMGEEDGHGAEGKLDMDMLLTDVDEAVAFVDQTGVDALAIAIGTSHGAYKFTKEPTGDILRIDRIKEIHDALPNTHLVMHGSSSVPQDWLEIINNYGGDMGQTYGVPVEEIQEGIKHGVAKVNIDTDLRMASTGAIRKFLSENPSNFDPRKFLKASTDAMQAICQARYEAFGCAGHASKIKAKRLEEMVSFYS